MRLKPKKFSAFWSKDFYNAGRRQVSERFFTVERCYTVADIEAISGLAIGEKWSSADYGSAHTVTRIS